MTNNNNDKRIQLGLTKFKEVLENLTKKINIRRQKTLRTNLLFPSTPTYINLRTLSPKNLNDVFTKINHYSNNLKDLGSLLDMEFIPFVDDKIGDYTIEDWKHDFKIIYELAILSEQVYELKQKINKLESLISKDLKTSMELDNLGI